MKPFFSVKSGVPLLPKLIDLIESHVNDKIVARESPENCNFNTSHLNDLRSTHIP